VGEGAPSEEKKRKGPTAGPQRKILSALGEVREIDHLETEGNSSREKRKQQKEKGKIRKKKRDHVKISSEEAKCLQEARSVSPS